MTLLHKIKNHRNRSKSPSLRPSVSNVSNSSPHLPPIDDLHPTNSSISLSSNNSILNYNTKQQPYSLSIVIESPPIMIYGPPSESTGYLLSGLLYLDVPNVINDRSFDLTPSKSRTTFSELTPSKSNNRSNLLDLSPSKSNSRPGLFKTPSSSAINNVLHAVTSVGNNNRNSSPLITPVVSSTSLNNSPSLTPLDHSPYRVLLKKVTLSLNQIITYGKPFLPPSNGLSNCPECRKQVNCLKSWEVLTEPAYFEAGKQAFPFSHLLSGDLPPTCAIGSSGSFSIRYELFAESSGIYEIHSRTSNNIKQKTVEINVKMPMRVSRSIIKSIDKNSLRIFPPSNVTVAASIPSVIHPKSSFIVELKFDGLNEGKKRWRLRKLNWKIQEDVQIKSHCCDLPYHKTKLKVIESNIKLNHDDKLPNSPYMLGKQVRKLHENTAGRLGGIPIDEYTPSYENDQESIQTNENNESFIHPEETRRLQQDQSLQDGIDNRQPPISNNLAKYELLEEKNDELFFKESRILEKGVVKEGWKSDYSNNGTIELAVDVSCRKLSSGLVNHINRVDSKSGPTTTVDKSLDIGNDVNCCCDIYCPQSGIYVNHILVLEANLAEEMVQSKSFKNSNSKTNSKTNSPNSLNPINSSSSNNTNSPNRSSSKSPTITTTNQIPAGIPTGLTRIFRMKFKLLMTERSGFGISWDEEVPPQYNQISSFSPPTYGQALAKFDEEMAELKI